MNGDVFLRRALQGIAGGHQASQGIRALPDRLLDRPGQRGRVTQPVVQCDDLCLAQLDVCDDLPLPGLARREAQRLGDEERAADAARMVLGPQRLAATEAVELR
jgi:hypothetical protein